MESGMLIIGIIISIILMGIGIFTIKNSSKGWNIVDLIFNRQGSGAGQFLSGLLLFIVVIILFFLKKNGSI